MKKIISLIHWLLKLLKNNYNKIYFYFYLYIYHYIYEFDIRVTKYINKLLSKFKYLYIPNDIIFHCTSEPKCHFIKKNKRQIIKIPNNWEYYNNFVFCKTCDDFYSLEWKL
jgi:hypothetical protein